VVTVSFTQNIQRHVACPTREVASGSVRAVLDAAFTGNDLARGYVLDDRGELRRHMNVFVNGASVQDRAGLSDPVPDGAEVYIMQALSGG
jgi:molybdopterin converting factor small subunit